MLNWLTAGESHGKALVGILEGIPAELEISEAEIAKQLSRRQKGHGRGGRMKIEQDVAEILSGIRHGKTLGSPIALKINNRDFANWQKIMSVSPVDEKIEKITLPRPGHADLAGTQKFGFDDIRNVIERSSARETAMRVGLGAICRKFLSEFGIEIASHVRQIHSVKFDDDVTEFSAKQINEIADNSPVRCLDSEAEKRMIAVIDEARKNGDSVGGEFEIIATGVPFGLGSYSQWDKRLNGKIAQAVMSIPAIKSVEIGAGKTTANYFGSEIHDEILFENGKFVRPTNNAGGIEGGISNSEPIVIRAVMKPIPTLTKPLRSVDILTKKPANAHKERTDSCAVPAASIVGEAMLAFVLAGAFLEKFGGDSLVETMNNFQNL